MKKRLRKRIFKIKQLSLVMVLLVGLLSCSILSGCGRQKKRADGFTEGEQLNNESTIVYPDVKPDYVMTYADNQTESYPTTQGGYRFAMLVNERTRGRIRIRVSADGALGEEGSVVDQIAMGGIDFARVSLVALSDYSDLIQVLMMPYLYRDSAQMWKALDGDVGQKVVDSLQGSGIVPLSWYDAGARSFYFCKKVDSLDGLKGLNVRVQNSPVMSDMVSSFGANPVPVDYDEVYDALQTGQVDGAENNWSSYEAMGHYKVAPYVLEDEHVRIPEVQIVSNTTMSQLSQKDQEIIRQAARESAEYERKLWQKHENQAREDVISKGVQVISVSDEERERARLTIEPLYETYCKDYMDLIKEIQGM